MKTGCLQLMGQRAASEANKRLLEPLSKPHLLLPARKIAYHRYDEFIRWLPLAKAYRGHSDAPRGELRGRLSSSNSNQGNSVTISSSSDVRLPN